jgi:hypothetical protein
MKGSFLTSAKVAKVFFKEDNLRMFTKGLYSF